MKTTRFLPVLLIFCLLTPLNNLIAQEGEVKLEKLTESVYALEGQGGNIGLCIGDDGVFMIDAQFENISDKILEAIRSISDKPLKYLVNTHWHHDHTNGNATYAGEGALIIGHKNVRKRVSSIQNNSLGKTTEPLPVEGWPVITFGDHFRLHINGEDILVFHIDHAHTDGDALVYFPGSNVIHMGDTYFNGLFPFIDVKTGGSIDGMIAAANKVLFLANDQTKIIPGHGNVSNKSELKTYRDMLMTIRDRIKSMISEGKSLEEIQTAGPTAEFDDPLGKVFLTPNQFVEHIHMDLARSKE